MATEKQRPWRYDLLLAAGCGVASLILYLCSLMRIHPPDAIAYALEIEERRLFHPQHLIHNWLGWMAVRVGGALEPDWVTMDSLQRMNAFLGALGVALMALVLCRATGRRGLSAVFAGGLAISYGWWSMAVTYEVHVAPLTAMLGLFLLMQSQRPPSGAAAGALHAAAILLHKTMILACPAVILALIVFPGSRRKRLSRVGEYAITGLVVAGAFYALALNANPVVPGGPKAKVSDLVIGELIHGRPRGDPAGRFTAGIHSWRRCLLYEDGPRCGASSSRDVWESATTVAQDRLGRVQAWTLVFLIAMLALILVTARRAVRKYPTMAVLVAGWNAVALPAILWFESHNYEYYLGPIMGLLIWIALSSTVLPVPHRSLRKGLDIAVPLLFAAVFFCAGYQSYRDDLGLMTDAEEHTMCTDRPQVPNEKVHFRPGDHAKFK